MAKVQSIRSKDSDSNRDNSGCNAGTRRCLWLTILAAALAVGCTSLKKAGIVSLATGTGAAVGTVSSGGVLAPILGAMTGAFVGDVTTEMVYTRFLTEIGGETMCSPDNFWTIIQSLVEIGGWALLLIFVAPMIIGWILPGPLERKKKN